MSCAKTGDPPDLPPGYSLQAYSDCSKPVCGPVAPASSCTWELVEKEYLFFSSTDPDPGFNTIAMTHVYFKL